MRRYVGKGDRVWRRGFGSNPSHDKVSKRNSYDDSLIFKLFIWHVELIPHIK